MQYLGDPAAVSRTPAGLCPSHWSIFRPEPTVPFTELEDIAAALDAATPGNAYRAAAVRRFQSQARRCDVATATSLDLAAGA
jgi:hypothetical protein